MSNYDASETDRHRNNDVIEAEQHRNNENDDTNLDNELIYATLRAMKEQK